MVEPPPILDVPPVQEPKPTNMLARAWWGTALLAIIVFVVSNILATPVLLFTIFGKIASDGLYAPTANTTIEGTFSPPVAKKLESSLAKSLPGTNVQVKTSSNRLEISVTALSGGSQPLKYQRALDRCLSEQGLDVSQAKVFHSRPNTPKAKDIMSDPVVILTSVFSLQLTILITWLVARKWVFIGERAIPPFHVGSVWKALLIGVAGGIATAFLASAVDEALNAFFHIPKESMWDVVKSFPTAAKVGVVLGGVVGAPIFEELFFRGVLIGLFQKANRPWLGVVVSSVLFGVAHLQNIAIVLSITMMGLILGTVYVKTKSIYATMTIHMVNNAISFAVLLLPQK